MSGGLGASLYVEEVLQLETTSVSQVTMLHPRIQLATAVAASTSSRIALLSSARKVSIEEVDKLSMDLAIARCTSSSSS